MTEFCGCMGRAHGSTVAIMRKAIRALAVAVSTLLLPLVASSADDDRWVPGFAASGGIRTEIWDARASSDVRGPFKGSSSVVSPFIGFSAEIMTPSLSSRAGKPRLFAHGGAGIVFDSVWNAAKEGSQGQVAFPIIDNDMDGVPDVESSVISATGTGSTAQHETERLRWSVGAGVAFTFEVMGRTLRVRPSIEYQWEQSEVGLFVSDAQSLDGSELCPCRILQLSSRETHAFHGIGPGLEFELDAGRAGPFSVSVFSGLRTYRVLGNREVRINARDTYDDGEPASAEAVFEKQAWSFNGGVGLRLRWLPDR